MTQKFTDQDVYLAVQNGLAAIKVVAANGVKRRAKILNDGEKVKADQALFDFDSVIANPAGYFSRRATEAQWRQRADEYADRAKLRPEHRHNAYHIVPNPVGVVNEKLQPAFVQNADLWRMFYQFCLAVQDWEYKRTSSNDAELFCADSIAVDIIRRSKRYCAMAEASKGTVQKVREWCVRSFSK